jgi:hypothetical protein
VHLTLALRDYVIDLQDCVGLLRLFVRFAELCTLQPRLPMDLGSGGQLLD